MNLLLGADIHAHGGTVQNQKLGVRGQPLGQDDPLLIAAGQVGGRDRGVFGGDVQLFKPILRDLNQLFVVQSNAVSQLVDGGGRHIVAERAGQKQPLAQTVLRYIADPQPVRVQYAADPDLLFIQEDLPGCGADPEQGLGKLGAPAAKLSGDPQDLVGIKREGNVPERARHAEIFQPEQRRGVRFILDVGVWLGGDLAPGHVIDQTVAVKLAQGGIQHLPPVAEDGDLLGYGHDLLQLMADKDHGDATLLQGLDDFVQGQDLLVRQRGGGLVHHQQLRILRDAAGNGHQLLAGDRQILHIYIQGEIHADAVQGVGGDPLHLPAVHDFFPCGDNAGKRNVFRHAQVRKNGKVLINDLDARLDGFRGGKPGVRLPVQQNLARIRGVHAGHDFDQGGFSGAVLTHQAVGLAFVN